MPRRILLSNNGLSNSSDSPPGFTFLGLSASSLSLINETGEINNAGGGGFNETSNYESPGSVNSNAKGGYDNQVIDTTNSTIIGGCSNKISQYGYVGPTSVPFEGPIKEGLCSISSSILGGQYGYIKNSHSSSIISGDNNYLYNVCNSTILSGVGNSVYGNSYNSVILGGMGSTIYNSESSSIITGKNNSINYCADYSSILAGRYNTIEGLGSYYSTILGGTGNIISYCSYNVSITGGCENCISFTKSAVVPAAFEPIYYSYGIYSSSIISGRRNSIVAGYYSGKYGCLFNSSIISGENNEISCNVLNSVIIGGRYNHVCGCIGAGAGPKSIISCGQGLEPAEFGGGNKFSQNSSIVAGQCNKILYSNHSSIIASRGEYYSNYITCSDNSTIIGHESHYGSYILRSRGSSIIGGYVYNSSRILLSPNSVIIGGYSYDGFEINTSFGSAIIASYDSKIYDGSSYSLLSGYRSCIKNSFNSAIIGGQCNFLSASNNSVIIGGECVQISSCDNVVAVPKLITGTFSSGSFNAWKFGGTQSAPVTFDTENYVEVEINGSIFKLALVY